MRIKKFSPCFNTDSFRYLINPWWLEFSKILWKEQSVNVWSRWSWWRPLSEHSHKKQKDFLITIIKVKKFIFVGVLISSLDLTNSLWPKLRANEPAVTLVLDTWWHNQNGSVFYFLDCFPFCLRKYWWLKIRHFLGRMTNKAIIRLKINLWKMHKKLNCAFKSMASFVYLTNIW